LLDLFELHDAALFADDRSHRCQLSLNGGYWSVTRVKA
jgi:hypothetical protein